MWAPYINNVVLSFCWWWFLSIHSSPPATRWHYQPLVTLAAQCPSSVLSSLWSPLQCSRELHSSLSILFLSLRYTVFTHVAYSFVLFSWKYSPLCFLYLFIHYILLPNDHRELMWCLPCRSVSTIRNQRYHIHANLSFAILVAEMLLLISARFDPGTVGVQCMLHVLEPRLKKIWSSMK